VILHLCPVTKHHNRIFNGYIVVAQVFCNLTHTIDVNIHMSLRFGLWHITTGLCESIFNSTRYYKKAQHGERHVKCLCN